MLAQIQYQIQKQEHVETTANATVPETDTDGPKYTPKSSSGLSTGGILGIAIPCIAALVGVGALAAFMGVPG